MAAAGKMAKGKEWSEMVGTDSLAGAIVKKNGLPGLLMIVNVLTAPVIASR